MQKLSSMMNDSESSFDLTIEEILQKERDRYNAREVIGSGVYDCPSCKNKGWVMIEDRGYNVVKECNCNSIRESDLNINRSGLNEVFRQMTFESWIVNNSTQKVMLEQSKKFVEEFDGIGWFYIGGNSGSGKTHTCTALFQELMKNSYVGTYKRWHEVIKQLKQEMNTKEYTYTMNDLKNCQLLYIDDFLKNASDSDMNIAFEIIQGRVDRHKATIISSELFLQEIKDEAISSRIKQMCGEYVLQIPRKKENNFRLKD